jgi:hypothetical protein
MAWKDENEPLYTAIGKFIFWFSQLEFTIKASLASYLGLKDEQFNVVIGPYDFLMLCTVAEKTIKLDMDQKYHPALKSFFDKCKKLNQEARVVVAHGSWTSAGARHVSRTTLEAKMHFEKPETLLEAADKAKKLMAELIQFGAVANS